MKSAIASWLLFSLLLWLPAHACSADKFVGMDVSRRDFSGQTLEKSDFTDAKCFLTNFRDAKLAGSTFKDADLTSASFADADLMSCDLRGATFANAGFQGADLSKAKLVGCDLTGISFQNAKLKGADLRKSKGIADCTRADFREANLCGANMLGMKDYGGATAKFTGAKYDKATRWPKGFDVEGSGAVLEDAEEDKEADESAAKAKPSRAKTDDDSPAEESTGEKSDASGAATAAAGGPSEKLIKKTLEKEMWGPPERGGTKHTYAYKSFKIAAPREGNFRTDGTPANKKTMVYPVKVEVVITREFTDGVTKEETKKQSYTFFQDEFGDWTYRFIQNN